MSKYLLYRSELMVIADALREYRKRHCGGNCMQSHNCSLYRSCEVIERDFDSSGDLITNISFYDDEPTIIGIMNDLGKECELRWLKESFSEFAMA